MGFWKSSQGSFWRNSGTRPGDALALEGSDVSSLCTQVMAVLDDCTGHRADMLRLRLQRAATAQDLWLARCDIYQLVASQHCETQAALRINALLPAFRPWMPARSLVAV